MVTKVVSHTEGEDFQAVAYVAQRDDSAVLQADVSSINTSVFDLDSTTPGTAVHTSTEVVSSSIFDTEQTDGYATRAGLKRYNFRPGPLTDAEHGMRTGKRYLIEYQLVGADVGGGDLFVRFSVAKVEGGLATA